MLTALLSAMCRACESFGLLVGCLDRHGYPPRRRGDIESQDWEREWHFVH